MIEEETTGRIIKIYYEVYNELGYGFLESVYQNAFIIELANAGLVSESEKKIVVYYQGRPVGTFEADLVVGGKILIELKSKEVLHPAHEAQLVNYLRATDIEIGLLFNFGKKPEFKRKFFSNENKIRNSSFAEINILESLFIADPCESA